MKFSIPIIVLCLLILFLESGYAETQTKDTSAVRSPEILAIGLGLETGMLGFKYLRWLNSTPMILGMGVGFEGIAPQLQISVFQIGHWSIYGNASVLISPWDWVIFSKGSVTPGFSVGLQRWPSQNERFGIFFTIGAGIYTQIRGESEGTDEDKTGPSFNLAVGLRFEAVLDLLHR